MDKNSLIKSFCSIESVTTGKTGGLKFCCYGQVNIGRNDGKVFHRFFLAAYLGFPDCITCFECLF